MAVTYVPFGGRRTGMNDYERADQQNALANAQMQQQSIMQGSSLAGQRGMADVTHNQALAVLDQQHANQLSQMDRRNELNERFRAGGLDYINFNELGGRDLASAQNQLGITQTGIEQQIAGARGELVSPALEALRAQFAADPQALSDAGLSLITGQDPARNRMAQEELGMRREEMQYNRERQAVQDELQRNQSELARVDKQRHIVAENHFNLAQVEQGRGNYARASQLMRQGLAVLLPDANPDDFSTAAERILPQESERVGVEQMQLVQEVAQRVMSVVPKEDLAKDLAKELMQEQTGEPAPPTRSGMLVWEEANRIGMADSRADFMNVYRQILRDLMQDPAIRRAVRSEMPTTDSNLARINDFVLPGMDVVRNNQRGQALQVLDESIR